MSNFQTKISPILTLSSVKGKGNLKNVPQASQRHQKSETSHIFLFARPMTSQKKILRKFLPQKILPLGIKIYFSSD